MSRPHLSTASRPAAARPTPPVDHRNQNLWVLALAQFAAALAFFFVMPLLPLFVRDLGATTPAEIATWSGIALGISPLGGALTTPWWSRLAARLGYRITLSRALLGIGVATGGLALASELWQVVALRGAIGVMGGFSTLTIAGALSQVSKSKAGPAVARIQSAQLAAIIVGPFVGGLLADYVGIRFAMLASAIVYVIGYAGIKLYYREAPRRAPEVVGGVPAPGLGTARFASLMLVLFAVQFADSSLNPILPELLRDLAAPESHLGTITGITLSAGALAGALAAQIAGRQSGKGRSRVLLLGVTLVGAALCAVFVLLTQWLQVTALRAALSLVVGGAPTLVYAIAAERSDRAELSRTIGHLGSAALYGAAIGPAAAGVIAGGHIAGVVAMNLVLYVAAATLLSQGGRRTVERLISLRQAA